MTIKLTHLQDIPGEFTRIHLRNTTRTPISKEVRDAWRGQDGVVRVFRGFKSNDAVVFVWPSAAAKGEARDRLLKRLNAA